MIIIDECPQSIEFQSLHNLHNLFVRIFADLFMKIIFTGKTVNTGK